MIDLVGNRTLPDLLDEAVADCGDKTWLTFESRGGEVTSLTYREFQQQVDRMAGALQHHGVEREHIVLLHMHNHPRFLVAWFALAILGVVSVPVNVDNTVAEIEHIVSLTRPELVITDAAHLDKYRHVRASLAFPRRIVSTSNEETGLGEVSLQEFVAAGAGIRPAVSVDSSDVMQMLFTSGTTARPKAAELTHANVLHGGERIAKGLALQSEDRCLTALPLFHVNAQVMAVLSSMTVRGSCVLLEGFSARSYWAQVRRHRATCTSLVAMQVRTILAQPPTPEDKEHLVRRFSFFINVTDEEKIAFEQRFGVRFINGYGLTEAMGIVAFTPVFGDQRWPAIGLPTADRRIRLVDENDHDVAPGEVGEIVVAGTPGRTVMRGYYKDEAATASVLRDGWLYTGDKAYADAKGYLNFVDRRVNLIKRAGENVSATEVELAILAHPEVQEVAVIGIPDAIRDERVLAIVVLQPDCAWDPEGLAVFCRTRLAAFKVPSDWKQMKSLPRTPIKGDVDKKALRALAAGQLTGLEQA